MLNIPKTKGTILRPEFSSLLKGIGASDFIWQAYYEIFYHKFSNRFDLLKNLWIQILDIFFEIRNIDIVVSGCRSAKANSSTKIKCSS